jgi:hypothetical protein
LLFLLEKKILKIFEEGKEKLEEETEGVLYPVAKNDMEEYMDLVIDERKWSTIFNGQE